LQQGVIGGGEVGEDAFQGQPERLRADARPRQKLVLDVCVQKVVDRNGA
jgi:hypothetical protein